ncbi:MAG: hydroxymethylbilane synthase [Rickettsiales bacterium]
MIDFKTADFTKILRLGTRSSRLALAQVAEIHILLADNFPNLKIEIVPIQTSGDKILDKKLADIGGKGLFVKELEEALLNNKIDVAIHSAKDVPPFIDEKTKIGAYSKRINPNDCFISKKYSAIDKLPKNSTIGTSSPRRQAFLAKLRPDLKFINLRGNVDTRLRKIAEDEIDATIMAVAGFVRLGKENSINHFFSTNEIIPSVGQGALALQIRNEDNAIAKICKKINDENTEIAVSCERAFLQELGASCHTPVGVYADILDDKINLKTAIIDFNGSEIFEFNISGKANIKTAIEIGKKAGEETKIKAYDLLKKILI